MGRGKFKGKPTGRRQFSTPEEMSILTRPRTFRQVDSDGVVHAEEVEQLQPEEDTDKINSEKEKRRGTEGIIEINNPNLLKGKNSELGKTAGLSRREREEVEKQKSRDRFMVLQELGMTEQAKKDLDRLAIIRRQRAEAAKKREQAKAAKELKKSENPK